MKLRRDVNLDLMRLLGVLLIMIAHAEPPGWLYQLRNFDVPLLIVASALAYSSVYSGRNINVLSFYKKRLMRLVAPAWIFLTFFFVVFYIAGNILGKESYFSLGDIFGSYSFYGGIGFVWIFKVFIILAILTPFGLKFNALGFSNGKYFLILSVLYLLYELTLFFFSPYVTESLKQFFNVVVFIVIPYAILYLYGVRLKSLSNRQVIYAVVLSLGVFTLLACSKYMVTGHIVHTQGFKYPPTIYYLSYAFFALNLVYLVCRNLPDLGDFLNAIIIWLSTNSLWIYLWHIMAFYLWYFTLGKNDASSFLFFFAKAVFMLCFGILCTLLQGFLVKRYLSSGRPVSKFLTAVLA